MVVTVTCSFRYLHHSVVGILEWLSGEHNYIRVQTFCFNGMTDEIWSMLSGVPLAGFKHSDMRNHLLFECASATYSSSLIANVHFH